MYAMRNGVLHRDGKPVFALGQSYYPSYHPQKIPVLPEGDQPGEMQKDLRAIRDAGFHLVRMAALGEVLMQGGEIKTRFDLPDRFCALCEALDLSSMIRLQGYSMNLRGFPDADMLDQAGREMPFRWDWFVRTCLSHPGVLSDNVRGTQASAAHFKAFPSVVSFQIYNEPAYPSQGFYDYHPHTRKAYHRWLIEQGLAPEDPPCKRPDPGQDPSPWVRFRLFSMQHLTAFLIQMGEAAKAGYELPETLTCHMSCPMAPGAAIRGEDYFATAQGMDLLGITSYLVHRGPDYHLAGLQLALAESAAATFGKHTWLVEYNARTGMPPQEWQRETYAAIGHGLKGILYYQWRADYPFEDGPEPEGFGLLYNNGEKTPVFDTAVAMNRLVNRLGESIATCEKLRSGIGILYSNHQNAFTDAQDNGGALDVTKCREASILSLRRLYTLLSQESIPVDFARAEDLAENPLGIHTLLLPLTRGLSEEELDRIDAFVKAGGSAYRFEDDRLGFVPYTRAEQTVPHGVVREAYDLGTLLEVVGVKPPAQVSGAPHVDARLLQGDGYALCCLIQYDPLERPVENAVLHLSCEGYQQARVYALDLPEEGVFLPVRDGQLPLPAFHYGAIIALRGGELA